MRRASNDKRFEHNMKTNEFDGLCALVIEDVPSMRQLIVLLLKEIGFRDVLSSEDGADGLNKVEHAPHPVDIIICDLEMPIISGLEFIQMLRRSSTTSVKDTPVIVVTGYSEERNLYQAVQAGVHGFLVKPVSRTALEKRVRQALKNPPIDPNVFNSKPAQRAKQVEVIEGDVSIYKSQPSPEQKIIKK